MEYGFFAFREAWNKLGQLSKEDAMTEYIGELSNIDVDWEEKVLSIYPISADEDHYSF